MSKTITNEDAPMRSFHVRASATGGVDFHIEAQEAREGTNFVSFVKYIGNMPYIVAIVPSHAFSVVVGSLPDAKELAELQERVKTQLEEMRRDAFAGKSDIKGMNLADLDDDMFSKGN